MKTLRAHVTLKMSVTFYFIFNIKLCDHGVNTFTFVH